MLYLVDGALLEVSLHLDYLLPHQHILLVRLVHGSPDLKSHILILESKAHGWMSVNEELVKVTLGQGGLVVDIGLPCCPLEGGISANKIVAVVVLAQ